MDPRRRSKTAPINPYDPRRADKWGYTDDEITQVIPGLEPIPEEEVEMIPKYPDIVVQLIGTDGNAYALLGKVNRALRQAGIADEERQAFLQEATAGDYNNLLAVIMTWVIVD
jgi:hypothetical protein